MLRPLGLRIEKNCIARSVFPFMTKKACLYKLHVISWNDKARDCIDVVSRRAFTAIGFSINQKFQMFHNQWLVNRQEIRE